MLDPTREDIARALMMVKGSFLWPVHTPESEPNGSNYRDADAVMELLEPALKRARAEGYDKGYDDCYDHYCRGNIRPRKNPYE